MRIRKNKLLNSVLTAVIKISMYRVYNPNSGEHHFIWNTNEITILKRGGWCYECISWYTLG
ncbi:hypothetical protein [Enterococcus sp. AZ196]|uniref:hypothetical protein n=1 Tax=Enterococcus sp. AZ196 TaxID=2774659 RepID=UPI003D26E964